MSDSKLISGKAFPRVNLLGNPSDIYGGLGLGFPIQNWFAEVFLDPNCSSDEEINLFWAARKVFSEKKTIHKEFGLRYFSDIPRQVGLAGSSALIMAALRVMAKAYNYSWTWRSLADATLVAERKYLGIVAGPMDRWIQAKEKLLFMNFSESKTKILPISKLPNFRILISSKPGQPSGSVHTPVMKRWENGDPLVKKIMNSYKSLVLKGFESLMSGDIFSFAECMERNFELRSSLFSIDDEDQAIIDFCKSHGCSAKLCGSGGSVIALMKVKEKWLDFEKDAKKKGIIVVEPQLLKGR